MTEVMQIFEDLLNIETVFTNKEALRPSYIPGCLPHRKAQIDKIASILVSALKGETPSNIFLYGKTGTGKTACARYVGKELEKMGETRGVPCYVLYLNCEVVDTQYGVLAHLARHFDKNIPMTGWPAERVYEEFKKAVDEEPKIVVITLDEIDRLVKKGDGILYNLSRINSELTKSKVSIIGISNDLKFVEFLDPRVISSLSEEEVIFPPYDANQLRDILEQRAQIGFKGGSLNDGAIPLCAALAAQEHGDARRALDILRVSGEMAERLRSNKVKEEHVRMAQEKIESDRIEEFVRTLPTQSKLVLYGIILLEKRRRSSGSINTGDVYRLYKQLCHKINIEVLTMRRVTELVSELDMLGIVDAPVISRGRGGRSKEISLSAPLEGIRSVLLEDFRLKPLSEEKHIQTFLPLADSQ
jgi:cell division control protein 6